MSAAALGAILASAITGIIASESKLRGTEVKEVALPETENEARMVNSKTRKVSGPKKEEKKPAVKATVVPVKQPKLPASGAIITKPPVAIGSTLSGKRTIVRQVKGGHILTGREFLTSAYGTGSITTWTMAAGVPLTPVVFVDSIIRQYGVMYSQFRWRKLAVHYVTTSPTTANGSIMIYYSKDRASTFLSQTSPNLLPFVLSDPHTTVSPQWQSFSVELEPDVEWKRTDYGMTDDLTHYSAGELFLLSKTSTTDSPGMLLMSYELEFREMNLTPRMLLWPQPAIAYIPLEFGFPSTTTAGSSVALTLGGTAPISGTPILSVGGIYKFIVDVTNSVFTGNTPATTAATLVRVVAGAGTTVVPLVDGTTIYAVNGPSSVTLFLNATDAYTGSSSLQWNVTLTAAGSGGIFGWFSLVGFANSVSTNPSM